eukprot:1672414-Prymnesium_polylepis.1
MSSSSRAAARARRSSLTARGGVRVPAHDRASSSSTTARRRGGVARWCGGVAWRGGVARWRGGAR